MDQPTTQVVVQTKPVEVTVATKDDIKVLEAKLSSLRAWGIAALLGGQAVAGVLAAIIAPQRVADTAEAIGRALPLL